jgi:hypothetical protein
MFIVRPPIVSTDYVTTKYRIFKEPTSYQNRPPAWLVLTIANQKNFTSLFCDIYQIILQTFAKSKNDIGDKSTMLF